MNVHTKKYLIDGPVGKIEVALDLPDEAATTAPRRAASRWSRIRIRCSAARWTTRSRRRSRARSCSLNYVTYRSNFRGVGETQGEHDNGIGERDDLRAVLDHMRAQPGQARSAARAGGLFVRHLRAVARGRAVARRRAGDRADGVRRHGGEPLGSGARCRTTRS